MYLWEQWESSRDFSNTRSEERCWVLGEAGCFRTCLLEAVQWFCRASKGNWNPSTGTSASAKLLSLVHGPRAEGPHSPNQWCYSDCDQWDIKALSLSPNSKPKPFKFLRNLEREVTVVTENDFYRREHFQAVLKIFPDRLNLQSVAFSTPSKS